MFIQKLPINIINEAPYNPRKDLQRDDPEYQKLEQSIEEFDCVQPLVFNMRTGNLVAGHQRLKILKAHGDKYVFCSVVDLPPEKEKALNIALNNISGEWDNQKLAQLLDELIKEPDFNFEVTGFDLSEATRVIDDILTENHLFEDNIDID
ncbi:MAG: ParB N-terminal domain-containing protein, partial [Planctomycetota bacterium]